MKYLTLMGSPRYEGLKYSGMIAERHLGYDTEFITDEKIENARLFAQKLIEGSH